MHDYLQKNYKAWHHHLHHHNDLKVSKKDLLFVRGYIKTARWAVAAFADSSREEGATVGGGHGPAKTSFSVDLSRQEALGGWTNVGLKRKEYRPDQCVFVQFLQYTTRDAFVSGCCPACTILLTTTPRLASMGLETEAVGRKCASHFTNEASMRDGASSRGRRVERTRR